MSLTVLAAAALIQSAQTSDVPHPYQLAIGRSGSIVAKSGIYDLRSASPSSLGEVVKAARGYRYVLVGESHDNLLHHQMQAEVIRALANSGRYVAVGMEMFTRDNQRNVTPFSSGVWSDEQFQTQANWKTQWGFDYALYKPIFDAVRETKSPLYALNAPRDWVREIGRRGPEAVDASREPWIPRLRENLNNNNHKKVFEALMGGHPMTGPQGDNIYAAQVSWDVSMATTAAQAMEDKLSDKWVMVIVAGSGHVMYGQAINYRLKKLYGMDSISLVCIEGAPDDKVSRGLGDFVYVSGEKPAK